MSETHNITVEVITHRRTGLIVAYSDDMPGLYVHGRSIEQVMERLPVAIRAIIEADGGRADEIVILDEDGAFRPNRVTVAAHYQRAA